MASVLCVRYMHIPYSQTDNLDAAADAFGAALDLRTRVYGGMS